MCVFATLIGTVVCIVLVPVLVKPINAQPFTTTTSTFTDTTTTRPRRPLVNPEPSPAQKAALFAFYDALRCRGDICPRVGSAEEICNGLWVATCNNSAVVDLYFENYGKLEGTIGSELLALTALTSLVMGNSHLSGTLSTYIGMMTNLEYLELHTNLFTGTIPTELGLMTNLRSLILMFNELEGTIPTQLALLTKLDYIDLSHNKLSGSVPPLSFVPECVLAAVPNVRFAPDGNCFDNCDNETICCEKSLWPCGGAIVVPDSDSNVALIVGVILGTLLAIAMVIVVVVVVRKSKGGSSKKKEDVSVRITNSGYAAASEMADNGLPPSAQLTPQVSRNYSNPLDIGSEQYNVMPSEIESPGGQQPYVPWVSLSPMARPMPSPPNAANAQLTDAHTMYHNLRHNTQNGQQSIPMPGSSGGLAQPYVAQPFIDEHQQHQRYRDEQFRPRAHNSPW